MCACFQICEDAPTTRHSLEMLFADILKQKFRYVTIKNLIRVMKDYFHERSDKWI